MMKLGVILPQTLLYGGVKRFVELGNIFVAKGHQFFIFTPDAQAPTWTKFEGEMKQIEEVKTTKLDAIFFTEPRFIPWIQQACSERKIFYFVRGNENLRKLKVIPNIKVFANSTNMYHLAKRRFGIEAFQAFGGIDTMLYEDCNSTERESGKPFTIMAYGRLAEGRKGTKYVVKACEKLYRKHRNIKLVLFDTPVNEKMKQKIANFHTKVPHEFILNHPVDKNPELFCQADVFVAPEKKAGWANTVVEAMASGVAVIATNSGTADFLLHEETGLVVKRNSRQIARAISRLMHDDALRLKYAEAGKKKIKAFDWHLLADKIEKHLQVYN